MSLKQRQLQRCDDELLEKGKGTYGKRAAEEPWAGNLCSHRTALVHPVRVSSGGINH